MAVALDEVLAREFERGRRLRCGLRTAAPEVSTLPSVMPSVTLWIRT